jgi:hypothetical protein
MESEVRRKPLCLRRRNAAGLIADDELRGGRLSVLVPNAQRNFMCGAAIEDHIDLVAKAEILCPLPDIEGKRAVRFPASRL